MTLPIAVLVSGSGSNLQAIIDRIEAGVLPARITTVLSNKADAHDVTLLHVCADDRCVDAESIFGRALVELKNNEIDDDRIAIKVLTSSNPAKTILHEAEHHKFAAVAIGRTSHKPSTIGHIFATTSLKILRGIEGAALWLCK